MPLLHVRSNGNDLSSSYCKKELRQLLMTRSTHSLLACAENVIAAKALEGGIRDVCTSKLLALVHGCILRLTKERKAVLQAETRTRFVARALVLLVTTYRDARVREVR